MVEGFGFINGSYTHQLIQVKLEIIPSPEFLGPILGYYSLTSTVSLSNHGISCACGPPAVHWAMRFPAAILANAPGYNKKSRLPFWFWFNTYYGNRYYTNRLLECYSLTKKPGEGSPTLQQFQGMSSILQRKVCEVRPSLKASSST